METTTYITTGEAKREIGEWDRSRERGRKLENMRLWKKRGVLTEVLTRLLGWQEAVSQAKGLAVGKELSLARWQQGDRQKEFNPHQFILCHTYWYNTNWTVGDTPYRSVHLDAQWEQHRETEMRACEDEKCWPTLFACRFIVSYSSIFLPLSIFSVPLFFSVSASVNIDSALGRLDS